MIFLFNTGIEVMEIDLAIINGEMAYHQTIAKVEEEAEVSKDIQDLETRDKNQFKTIHGDSN